MPDKARKYLKKVDLTLENLRALCLGQHTNLTDLLPTSLQKQPPEIQADILARQILFALVRDSKTSVSANRLQQTHGMLAGAALYLLKECGAYDQTFFSLKRLLLLPSDTRKIFFENFKSPYKNLLISSTAPQILKEFDTAIWWLLNTQDHTADAEITYQKIENILFDLSPRVTI